MIDFHTHVLPGMDDGAADEETSLGMLRLCTEQGVDTVFATSHFYADEEDPASFLKRRAEAFRRLREAYAAGGNDAGEIPTLLPGAEILYFPGLSDCEELKPLALGDLGLLSGVTATCYPGWEDHLKGANLSPLGVVTDGNFTTGRGMGYAVDLGLELVSILCSPDLALQIKKGIQHPNA